MTATAALAVDNVTKSFGGVHAIADVSFNVRAGSLTALIGPNGAGKSTMFNLFTNLYIADSGSIAYFGQDLAGMRSDKIARLGLIRTFQTARVFAGMTVLENVLAGAHIGVTANLWEEALRLPRAASQERTVRSSPAARGKRRASSHTVACTPMCAPARTFSSTVIPAKTRAVWNVRIKPRRAILSDRMPARSWPK